MNPVADSSGGDHWRKKTANMSFTEVLMFGFLGIVTLVWMVNFFLSILIPGYTSDPQIHIAFMGAIGLVTTLRGLVKKTENSK